MSRTREGRAVRYLSNAALAVGMVLFLGGFGLLAVVYQPYAVPTDSMAPSVAAGDRVLAQRIDGPQVRRGDVVVFREQAWGDLPMIKRVAGVGGDTVACCDSEGRLTVNGEPVEEPYLDPGWAAATAQEGGFEAKVPDGELFLLGDQRLDSLDSRTQLTDSDAGSVPRGAVSARVEATLWPPDRTGLLPRPEGFEDLPGGISGTGPLVPLSLAVGAGAVLIVAASVAGPVARRASRARAGAAREAQ
ncbi:signal peptidase I [Streptomyces sodiiphilus]|uniref:Signal peptidase I n=1 Tax=Streptomyces sodiiphilus TaxID=226217 RepID=A0ABN2NSI4_9ACTN